MEKDLNLGRGVTFSVRSRRHLCMGQTRGEHNQVAIVLIGARLPHQAFRRARETIVSILLQAICRRNFEASTPYLDYYPLSPLLYKQSFFHSYYLASSSPLVLARNYYPAILFSYPDSSPLLEIQHPLFHKILPALYEHNGTPPKSISTFTCRLRPPFTSTATSTTQEPISALHGATRLHGIAQVPRHVCSR